MTITRDQALSLFDYSDGKLVSKVNRGRARKGDILGTIMPNGYFRVGVFGKQYLVHRIIFLMHYGFIPDFIDHIDTIRSNNKIENLREASSSNNSGNARKSKRNTSGFKGVTKASKNRWAARIRCKGKCYFLGLFDSPENAHSAYKAAAEMHFGQFSRPA